MKLVIDSFEANYGQDLYDSTQLLNCISFDRAKGFDDLRNLYEYALSALDSNVMSELCWTLCGSGSVLELVQSLLEDYVVSDDEERKEFIGGWVDYIFGNLEEGFGVGVEGCDRIFKRFLGNVEACKMWVELGRLF